MRLFTLFISLFMFAACSSSPEPISYYQLDGGNFAPNKVSENVTANVIIANPSLVGHLANRGIVVEVSELQIQSANAHLWSAMPAELLLQSAVVNLDRNLDAMRVIPLQLESAISTQLPTYRVDYYLNKFQADQQGNGVIAGTVTIYKLQHTTADIVFSRGFNVKIALAGDGYAPLVKALNSAWKTVNQSISEEIKTLVENKN